MPNGFTSDIYEGKNTSLRDYLMGVGRGMGFAIMQRDDDSRDPVKHREVSTYHAYALADAQNEHARLLSLSWGESEVEAAQEYDATLAAHEKANAANEALAARYDDMIAAVQEWPGVPEVPNVKVYALTYLRDSKQFDCGSVYPPKPEPQPTIQWKNERVAKALRDIEYHSAQWEQEKARVAEVNAMIDAFYRSLPS